MRRINLVDSRNGLCKRRVIKALGLVYLKLRDDYFIAVVVICISKSLIWMYTTFEINKCYLQDT